jgi:putative oxidoreductase
MSALFRTTRDPVIAIVRLTVALVLFPHGAQHVLGWFGGYGFQGTYGWMTGTLGFPPVLAAVALVTEISAPFALLLGAGGRVAALGVIGLMLGALSTHVANGFFMNWFGTLPAGSEGFEYHLLMIALAGVVAVRGSGAWSVDAVALRRTASDPAARPLRAAA